MLPREDWGEYENAAPSTRSTWPPRCDAGRAPHGGRLVPARSRTRRDRSRRPVVGDRSSPPGQHRPGRAAGRAAARPRLGRAQIVGLADAPAAGPAYAAVRAPIAEGGGYAWFANRGIGRPVAESLRETMDWFRGWLDAVAPAGGPVCWSASAAARPSPAACCSTTRPDRPARRSSRHPAVRRRRPRRRRPPRRRTGVRGTGDADTVIPRELLDRTWTYLLGESGAPTVARRDPVGHGIAPGRARRAGRLAAGAAGLPRPPRRRPPGPTRWPTLPEGVPPARRGPPGGEPGIPQEQRSDTAPAALQEQLFARLAALPGVTSRPVGHLGARRPRVHPGAAPAGPDDAFLVPAAGEFAHLHPGYDGSLHLALPPALAADADRPGLGGRAPARRRPAHPGHGPGLRPADRRRARRRRRHRHHEPHLGRRPAEPALTSGPAAAHCTRARRTPPAPDITDHISMHSGSRGTRRTRPDQVESLIHISPCVSVVC